MSLNEPTSVSSSNDAGNIGNLARKIEKIREIAFNEKHNLVKEGKMDKFEL